MSEQGEPGDAIIRVKAAVNSGVMGLDMDLRHDSLSFIMGETYKSCTDQ